MEKENKHQCLFCNSIFSSRGSLKTHEDSVHKNMKFDCQDCEKQYTEKGQLKRHIKNVHEGIKSKCDQCDNEFTVASCNSSGAHDLNFGLGFLNWVEQICLQ